MIQQMNQTTHRGPQFRVLTEQQIERIYGTAIEVQPVTVRYFGREGDRARPLYAWWGTMAFSGQIFADFAGYSDIAIGVARLLGFEIPENFDRPHQAKSIGDAFRELRVPVGDVISSEYFRAWQTADLAFGRYTKNAALNFEPAEEYTDEQFAAMRRRVMPLASAIPGWR